jgi:hypothetical protein
MSAICDTFIAIWSFVRIYIFTVALDVAVSDSVDGYRRFGGTHCLRFKHEIAGVAGACKMYAIIYQITRRHMPYNPYLVRKIHLLTKCFNPPSPRKIE